MFASKSQKSVEIMGEPYAIRKLSWSSLDKARQAKRMAEIAEFRAMGGEMAREMFRSPEAKALEEAKAAAGPAPEKPIEEKRKARYEAYDRQTILVAGILDMRPDQVADIEAEPARLLHEAIIDYSLPALDPAEAEAPKG